jgi:hypothetical protein
MITNSLLVLVLVALVSAGCASRAQHRAAQRREVRAWAQQARPEIRAMYGAAQNVEVGGFVPQLCAQLAADTAAVSHLLPSPDDALTDAVARAVHDYTAAAAYCVNGDPRTEPLLTAGDHDLRRVAEPYAARRGVSLIWEPGT